MSTEGREPVTTRGFYISAPWRSSGKTVVSLGLARAARRREIPLQTFKKGPDYIDPLWMKQAGGSACFNLDPFMQSDDELRQTFAVHAANARLVLIEGTQGLHDGLDPQGSDSNAAIARKLGLPVLLIMDCRGMHRTVAALIKGLVEFDPAVRFAGIILNRVRSPRHESKIRQAIDTCCELPVIGALPEQRQIHIDEKELGLIPAVEHAAAEKLIEQMADLVEKHSDLDTLFPQAVDARSASHKHTSVVRAGTEPKRRIGLVRDEAFHFYYQDDLLEMERRGVELVPLSALRDAFPTELDGLLIGGGFPERFASQLSGNRRFCAGIREATLGGMPVRAECGGLMYLCSRIRSGNQLLPLADVLQGTVHMQKRPVGRGYVILSPLGKEQAFHGHEFHHSTIDFDVSPEYVYNVKRGHGIDGEFDGARLPNGVATYAHFRHTINTPWIDWFLNPEQGAPW